MHQHERADKVVESDLTPHLGQDSLLHTALHNLATPLSTLQCLVDDLSPIIADHDRRRLHMTVQLLQEMVHEYRGLLAADEAQPADRARPAGSYNQINDQTDNGQVRTVSGRVERRSVLPGRAHFGTDLASMASDHVRMLSVADDRDAEIWAYFDAADWLRQILQCSKAQFKQLGIRVTCTLPSQCLVVVSGKQSAAGLDAGRAAALVFTQMIMNILQNSMDELEKIPRRQRRIQVTMTAGNVQGGSDHNRHHPQQCVIIISDSGPGFATPPTVGISGKRHEDGGKSDGGKNDGGITIDGESDVGKTIGGKSDGGGNDDGKNDGPRIGGMKIPDDSAAGSMRPNLHMGIGLQYVNFHMKNTFRGHWHMWCHHSGGAVTELWLCVQGSDPESYNRGVCQATV